MPQNRPEAATAILAIATSLRSKLQRFQSQFNNPVLLKRLVRQTKVLVEKCLRVCERADSKEAYDALVQIQFLISDFALVCQKMNSDEHNKLHLLSLKLHQEIHFNHRRISAGHPKKVLA